MNTIREMKSGDKEQMYIPGEKYGLHGAKLQFARSTVTLVMDRVP